MTWDPDLPSLLVEAHLAEIQRWVREMFAGRVGRVYRLVPDELSLAGAPTSRVVALVVNRQRHKETGEERIVVQPASRDDLRGMIEWARRHEKFKAADFVRARSVLDNRGS